MAFAFAWFLIVFALIGFGLLNSVVVFLFFNLRLGLFCFACFVVCFCLVDWLVVVIGLVWFLSCRCFGLCCLQVGFGLLVCGCVLHDVLFGSCALDDCLLVCCMLFWFGLVGLACICGWMLVLLVVCGMVLVSVWL